VHAALADAAAFGQVPQDVTYTGRLVNDQGSPLAGPVDLELRVFDADTAGIQLYSEQHLEVALDATGGFSVQLSPVGTFDAALFANVNRWMEVVVASEVLTPRPIIASVPWALVAQQANKIVPDSLTLIEVDCNGNGVLQDAIDTAGPNTTILVVGTCNENIVIGALKTNLTIDGQNSASITPGSGAAILIAGRAITIRNFAAVTGGGRGIAVEAAGFAVIENNIIDGSSTGISIESDSVAKILGNTVQNAGNNGIAVKEGSTAEIGNCGEGEPNVIRANGASGILVTVGSKALVFGNQILDNAEGGIFVIESSVADTGSNDLSGNSDGVDVRRGSSLVMGRASGSGCVESPNSTTSNNTQFGVQCDSLSTVGGRLGTLSGATGNDLNDTNADCPDCCFTDLAP